MAPRIDSTLFFPGTPSPLGLSRNREGWNFALFSAHAESVELGLFSEGEIEPFEVIPMIQTQSVWHRGIKTLPPRCCYGVRCRSGLSETPPWLLDPYATILNASTQWKGGTPFPLLAYVTEPERPRKIFHPRIPKEELIVYEMHIRGFTAHHSSAAEAPGTYAGVIEKIPHLKKLGINAVELMPIFEFDECHCHAIHPYIGEKLINYWGYDPLSFFAPKRNFAKDSTPLGAKREFQQMVDALHREGIEVILDVVYNHTGEGGGPSPAISWRGIDKQAYYLLDANGKHLNFTGCGHTVNANHPAMSQMILDSLRYWVEEMGVDGFRFDLASVLTRGCDGKVMKHPPLIEAIGKDPILSQTKLIAEAWDAKGLYQVGAFPRWGPWSEWNGRYRDIVRRFLKGTSGKVGKFAAALAGSSGIYPHHDPTASVNFVTAHDGFSLRDLVTYQTKHNWENGEWNRDGNSQNDNWNCGIEGPTCNPEISLLRERQMRNFWLALLLSQGIPMILMGDEYGHTRRGNNNPYDQDNELNWFLWSQLQAQEPVFEFVRKLIAWRKKHPSLRRARFLTEEDIAWHGSQPDQPDWSEGSRFIAFHMKEAPMLYAAFNADYNNAHVELPGGIEWRLVVDTKEDWSQHWFDGEGPLLTSPVVLPPHSALLAIGV